MIVDLRDLHFLMEWLRVDELLARPRFADHSREDIDAVLALAEQIGEEVLAPHLRASDLTEPKLGESGDVVVLAQVADAVRQIGAAGLFGMVFDQRDGGSQLPHLVYVASLGILMSANLATASFMLLTVGNARLLATYGTPAQIAAFAEPEIAGRAMGTMCLSEPHAGSALGEIRTRALADGKDALGRRFRLRGSKMWISGGDQDFSDNIVHLVLAKTAGPDDAPDAGSRSISLFVVPKYLPDGGRNDIAVAGLNHKMGYRGLPNCALNFGEGRFQPEGRDGAIGWLIGEVGQGLPQMFQMMNEARISVGLAGAMLACRGYRMSLDYARSRLQGRVTGVATGGQVPIIEHADVRRMLLAQKAISQGALALVLYSARLLDDEKTADTAAAREEAGALLALLTPVTKSWPSEWAQLSLHHALQIFGGAGYTRDFEIEQIYRDNRLNPIHEGTTGIQGIDLVGRKIRRDAGRACSLLAHRIRALIGDIDDGSPLRDSAGKVATALDQVEQAVAALLADSDDRRALAHGTPFLFAFGHLVVGWLWLDQAVAARAMLEADRGDADTAFLHGRIRTNDYFAEVELPKVAVWLQPVIDGSSLVLDMPLDQF